MARIELRNIVKTFGGQNAVQNLDMTIEDGELLVLLGPSGCGKSTTMNMIAGLTDPTSGRILFDGVDVTDRSPHERNIAMVFQSSLLYPHLSARDNIYMSLKRSGLSKQQIEARWAGYAEAAEAFTLRKRAANSVDYDDLLVLWRRLLQEFPDQLGQQARMFRHILVDEMQDTNALQMEIVETVAEAGEGNLTAVGDDAQSIYKFRGAAYDNILKFPERHPGAKIFSLEVNYRSTPQVVALTDASIARNTSGFAKSLTSARPSGPRVEVPAKMTSSILPPRSVFAPCSPITQASASTTFDLPEPFGPTIAVTPGSNWNAVGCAKDLKPLSVRLFRCTRPPFSLVDSDCSNFTR